MQKSQEFDKKLFAGEIKEELIAQAAQVFLSNQRQVTAKTKTRSEVRFTKKKWYRQKGTGNARHGARTPAIFVGGGVSHGPNGQQNYQRQLNSKMKKKALLSALALQADKIFIDDVFTKVDGKTKSAVKALADNLKNNQRLLLVVEEKTPDLLRSYNNLEQVFLVTSRYLNLMHILNADQIIINPNGAKALAARLLEEGK